MIQKAAALGLAALLLSSCGPLPKQAPPPPSSASAPESASQDPAQLAAAPEPPMAPTDVRSITCGKLSGAQDDDKAYASTFLLGYRSALMRTHTIDIKRIEAVEEAALAECATKPDAKASQVFHEALLRIGPGGEAREIHHHHRHHATPASATEGAPEQTTPTTPAEGPSMQYAPAPGTSMQAAPGDAAPGDAPPGGAPRQ